MVGVGSLGGSTTNVSLVAQADRDGTWAEYFLANATDCIPLKRRVEFEAAASLIVNPLTAIGLLDTARRAGHRAAIHTAGASQLGRMLICMAARNDYPIICVVRRDVRGNYSNRWEESPGLELDGCQLRWSISRRPANSSMQQPRLRLSRAI